VQKNILEKHPTANVRVYVVWFSMIFSDTRSAWRWTGHVITDPRVVHFWDEQRLVGRWFAQQENAGGNDLGIVWDAYFLYPPKASWDATPQPLTNSGSTIRGEYNELEKNLIPLLTAKSERS
jgi:hypothetical protein